jgi:hypothetical protein
MGIFESRNELYRISREVELSVLNDPVELRFVSKQFENNLRYAGYKYIYLYHQNQRYDKKVIRNKGFSYLIRQKM